MQDRRAHTHPSPNPGISDAVAEVLQCQPKYISTDACLFGQQRCVIQNRGGDLCVRLGAISFHKSFLNRISRSHSVQLKAKELTVRSQSPRCWDGHGSETLKTAKIRTNALVPSLEHKPGVSSSGVPSSKACTTFAISPSGIVPEDLTSCPTALCREG